jgi:murein DD-endopeptidase MepM/ murein hydrolase activator NlpD
VALVIHRFANVYARFQPHWEHILMIIKTILAVLLLLPATTPGIEFRAFRLTAEETASSPSLATASGTAPTASTSWQLPFATPHRLVRHYLQPTSDYSAGHRGVDFEVALGDKLVAPSAGTISFAKKLVNRQVIAIRHGSNLVSELEPACSLLAVGSLVSKGEEIGFACSADDTYRQHCPDQTCLHFSLRVDGKYLSPLALVGGLNPSRLLPTLESIQARG